MLPEVSRISYGGKVRPHKELFLIQSDMVCVFVLPFPFLFESSSRIKEQPFLPP